MLTKQIERAICHVNAATLFIMILLLPVICTCAVAKIFSWPTNTVNYLIAFTLISSLAAAFFVAKLRLRLIAQARIDRLEKTAQLDLDTVASTQASFSKSPRKLSFNTEYGGNSPVVYQTWMLCNPFLWLMIYYLVIACTIDEELRQKGTACSAKLVQSTQSDNTNHAIRGTTSSFQQLLTFEYQVNDQTYKLHVDDCSDPEKYTLGKSYPLKVLSDRPEIFEPLGSASGTKQYADFYAAMLFLLANLLFEFWIWYQPLCHYRLAKIGEAVPVKIKKLICQESALSASSVLSPSKFTVIVERLTEATSDDYHIEVEGPEYGRLQVGDIELALIDPVFKQNAILYRFCKYQVSPNHSHGN